MRKGTGRDQRKGTGRDQRKGTGRDQRMGTGKGSEDGDRIDPHQRWQRNTAVGSLWAEDDS